MPPAPVPILSALLPAALLLTIAPAEARPRPRPREPHHRAASDMDATLARMAARDRLRGWRVWQEPRPLARVLPPATRERVAAPPFTGWGYGGPIPGAWPGF
ncbi:hypothetical protein MKL09_11820 [Methylobacterium sp. J-048]|uniref:hypothetical protein n=1 Tax=Methylobacterium sp. J-048 TaxID=2836635 RepID=UPI001FBA7DFD|nr:hypothetical protein [Methylobacterium sp. J-048]MCJ2057241.1 hypothetical protein [Methylobacterium sp. J-048]